MVSPSLSHAFDIAQSCRTDMSENPADVKTTTIPYDELVYTVGAENNTFGIPGTKEYALPLKEIWDGERIRKKLMDCMCCVRSSDLSDSVSCGTYRHRDCYI